MTTDPMVRRLLLLAVLTLGPALAGCGGNGMTLRDHDRTLSGAGSTALPRIP